MPIPGLELTVSRSQVVTVNLVRLGFRSRGFKQVPQAKCRAITGSGPHYLCVLVVPDLTCAARCAESAAGAVPWLAAIHLRPSCQHFPGRVGQLGVGPPARQSE